MKRFRFFTLYITVWIKRYWRVLLVCLLVILCLFLLVAKFHKRLFRPSVTEGLVGTYTEDNLPSIVTSLLSVGLVSMDESLQPKPNLVSGWQVNSDVTFYTFKLKPSLVWTDGSGVSASDLSIGVSDAAVSSPDSSTLQVKLSDSFSPLPSLLTKPVLKKGKLVGLGPYRVSSIEKNSIFIRKIKLISDSEDLPDVNIRFYPNEKVADEALKLGEVQSLLGVGENNDFSSSAFVTLQKPNTSRLVAIFYNTQDPILSDKNFRLALSYATPTIAGEQPATTPIPPQSWAYYTQARSFRDNSALVKPYLDKVKGWKDSTIVLTATSSLGSVGQDVVDAWNRQGIKSTLRVESGIPQNFQALLITQEIPLDPDQYALWHSTQTQSNISKYSSPAQYSPRVDKDLEDGRKTTNQDARKKAYQDFQKVLLEDSPATFLYFPKYNVISLKGKQALLGQVLKIQLRDIGF